MKHTFLNVVPLLRLPTASGRAVFGELQRRELHPRPPGYGPGEMASSLRCCWWPWCFTPQGLRRLPRGKHLPIPPGQRLARGKNCTSGVAAGVKRRTNPRPCRPSLCASCFGLDMRRKADGGAVFLLPGRRGGETHNTRRFFFIRQRRLLWRGAARAFLSRGGRLCRARG